MTNQNVFDSALRMIGEEPGSAGISDYTARAPYLICAACRALAPVDRMYRLAHGRGVLVLPEESEYPLDEGFPLSPALHSAAACHIAAALLFDENPVLSDKCHTRFAEQARDILAALPARVEQITNQY